jgi:hypothetical protein
MRSLAFTLVFLFLMDGFAVSYKPIDVDKKVSEHIKRITATNNVEVYLKSLKPLISLQSYDELKSLVDQSKMYQAKKGSHNSFSLQFSGDRWVRFEFDTKNNLFLVGKKSFKWDAKIPFKENMEKLYSLVNSEYPKKKSAASYLELFPKAYAWSLFGSDEPAAMVAASSASLEPSLSLDAFMNKVQAYCENSPLGYDKAYFSTDKRAQLKVDFESAKEIVSSNGALHGFGLWTNKDLIGRFYELQMCLRDKRILTDPELLKIDYNLSNGKGTVTQ